jgi:hypothetical protein
MLLHERTHFGFRQTQPLSEQAVADFPNDFID